MTWVSLYIVDDSLNIENENEIKFERKYSDQDVSIIHVDVIIKIRRFGNHWSHLNNNKYW